MRGRSRLPRPLRREHPRGGLRRVVDRVEAQTPEAQAKIDWFADQPGLAEFRDRAVDAGKGPFEGTFEGCGS